MNQPSSESNLSPQNLYSLSQLPELSASKQVSAEHFLQQGNRHYNNYLSREQKQDLEMAIVHYKEALDLNPGLPEAHVKLASALWDKGDLPLEAALDYCETCLRLNPLYYEAHLFKGYFLRHAKQWAEATEQFKLAIQKAGTENTAKARMALGRVLLDRARLPKEGSLLSRLGMAVQGFGNLALGCCLLPGDPKILPVFHNALISDIKVFSLLGAGRILKTLHLHGVSRMLYEWATRQMPQEAIFFHLLGDLHTRQDNFDAALYFYNRAKELDPENALIFKKLGQVYRECNDSANAMKSLEKVVNAEAGDFETVYSLAQLYSDRGDFMKALYHYKELLTEAPNNPYLHSNVGYILFKLEDFDGAILEYQSAIKLGKDPLWTATIAQTLGTIYYQTKQDLDSAARLFQMACRLDPNDLDCLAMLGDIYTDQGHFADAIQAYQYILKINPDNAECYNYLGYLLWQMDQNDEAVEAYRKAIDLKLDNPIAYNNLGVIYLDEKCQLAQALEMFEQAITLKTDYTLACFNVARSHEAMGHTAEAAKTYTRALALNTLNPELEDEEIQERLVQLFQV